MDPILRTEEAETTRQNYMRRLYYRVIEGVDDNVLRVLNALDALDLAKDTLVVFASDNGYMNGEHGLLDKRAAYEESIRIPLLVRYPRRVSPGGVSPELVLNVDLAPTILDFAGVAIPEVMHGRSLRPLLEQHEHVDWRRSFLYEYYAAYQVVPTLLAVRTADWKLVKYPEYPSWTELFDLSTDPLETSNLIGLPQHAERAKALEALLWRHDEELGTRPVALRWFELNQ